MLVYRISNSKYQEHLNGEGAYRFGGRWNNKGTRMVYTSSSVSLATLEVLVHSDGLPIHKGLIILTIEIPDELVLSISSFPSGWDAIPPSDASIKFGNQFIADNTSLAIAVPSVVVPQERNILINPNHPDFSKVVIKDKRSFVLDGRINRKL